MMMISLNFIQNFRSIIYGQNINFNPDFQSLGVNANLATLVKTVISAIIRAARTHAKTRDLARRLTNTITNVHVQEVS